MNPLPLKAQGSEYSRAVPYTGSKLEGNVYLCRSGRVVSAGFRRSAEDGSVNEVTDVATQQNVTTWRITVMGGRAEVVAFVGATQTLEAAEQFTVQRGASGLLLTRPDSRPSLEAGLAAQTMTIDVTNSSFVYSGQIISPFMNKTNIFVGYCSPHF